MKAKLVFRSGNKILLPKEGQAALLLLEFIRESGKKNVGVLVLISDSPDKKEEGFFVVRLPGAIKETFIDAICYINANLPVESHNQGK